MMLKNSTIYTSYRRLRYSASSSVIVTDLIDELIIVDRGNCVMYCLDKEDRAIWKNLIQFGLEATIKYFSETFSLEAQAARAKIEGFIREMLSRHCLKVV